MRCPVWFQQAGAGGSLHGRLETTRMRRNRDARAQTARPLPCRRRRVPSSGGGRGRCGRGRVVGPPWATDVAEALGVRRLADDHDTDRPDRRGPALDASSLQRQPRRESCSMPSGIGVPGSRWSSRPASVSVQPPAWLLMLSALLPAIGDVGAWLHRQRPVLVCCAVKHLVLRGCPSATQEKCRAADLGRGGRSVKRCLKRPSLELRAVRIREDPRRRCGPGNCRPRPGR